MLAANIRSTETRYGEMFYVADDMYIGRSLELYGEYSRDEIELCRKFVKPNWVIVNGGANIGALTLSLASLVPDGKVYAFEPQPEHYELLTRNVGTRDNIETINKALWHSRGDSKMALYEQLRTGENNYGNTRVGIANGLAPVQLIALDDWLDGRSVDFIFLDVEGTEVMALEGARETIKRCRPILYVENDGQGEKPIPYIRRLDYLCYEHNPNMYSPDNWKRCPQNIFADVDYVTRGAGGLVSFNVLCIPKERIAEFRHVTSNSTKFHLDKQDNKLKMVVPRSPSQGASCWAAFVRGGGVGDNLIAASVARPLKELGYKVEVITQGPNDVVFDNNPFIDKISVHDANDWPTDPTQWQEAFRIRAKEYGKFANFGHSVECRHALFANQTWFHWPAEYRRKLCAGSYIETAHDIIGVPHTFGRLFWPTDEELEQAFVTKQKLGTGPVIAWCLSGTRVDKVYPYASLVIARLIKELRAQVVMIGAPPPHRDAEIAKFVMDSVKEQNGTLDGLTHAGSPDLKNQTWPVRRILTFAMSCDLYIGGDTGPSWGVAFEPIPKIIMISHASAENITKHWINCTTLQADAERVLCFPCHRLHDDFKFCTTTKTTVGEFAACISDISAETILSNATRLLRDYKLQPQS